jgi:hypothetical protein
MTFHFSIGQAWYSSGTFSVQLFCVSLILMEAQRLRVFDNQAISRIVGPNSTDRTL